MRLHQSTSGTVITKPQDEDALYLLTNVRNRPIALKQPSCQLLYLSHISSVPVLVIVDYSRNTSRLRQGNYASTGMLQV
jgi:hypothetical protein